MPLASLPGSNPLAVAYVELREAALALYSHAPASLDAAVRDRSAPAYPRRELAGILARYNAALGAPEPTMRSIAALEDPRSLCVLTGQQAGFLGGPLYTTYKIVTAIRAARELERGTGRPAVPVFWLASEDHDFQEVNHTFLLDRGGEVRRLSFAWTEAGRPVSDLPLTSEVRRALDRYREALAEVAGAPELGHLLEPEPGDSYSAWIARLALRAFGTHGLVVVEPRLLARLAGPFFAAAFARSREIRDALEGSARALRERGFEPALDPEQAGCPFRFSPRGLRVRSERDPSLARAAMERPGDFSADAALRPVLQDTLFPTAASVLGPGEIAYQGMLRPLYELYGLPQPLLLPRLTLSLLTEAEADTASRCGLDYRSLAAPRFQLAEAMGRAVSQADRDRFAELRRGIDASFGSVAGRLAAVDPNLRQSVENARRAAERAAARLELKAFRALLAGSGLGARQILALRATLFPRGSPQERVYPLPFLLGRHGASIIDELFSVGHPLDFRHHLAAAPPR